MRSLRVAQSALRCSELRVVNLLPLASADIRGVAEVGLLSGVWKDGRLAIEALLDSVDEVIFAWGVSPVRGPANGHLSLQIEWVREEARRRNLRTWTLGGQPRHPSRWHQYLSDVHGRTNGGTFQERVRDQLLAT